MVFQKSAKMSPETILLLVLGTGLVRAQAESGPACYSSGSIALSVILTILVTVAVLAGLYYLLGKYRRRKEQQLILETTDLEKGKTQYAFDNPGFKEPGFTPIAKSEKLESNKHKWTQWSPLSVLTTKSEKKKTLDDSAIDGNEVKVVVLRSHDFTGLGFNICGNMKEGIYIKDVLHRGPASESGKLNPGDRINSVTISFEHMVYEDALTILSYASPYEVIVEARGGKIMHHSGGQSTHLSHPVYRSSSSIDLQHVAGTSSRRLFTEDNIPSENSNNSSLQKSRSNMTTLERKESQSPQNVQSSRTKKATTKSQMSPEQLKNQLEQKVLADHENNLKTKNERKVEAVMQKTENKFQKFGIRVLPSEKSPKTSELSQNENNINFEKQPMGIDEVDDKKPQAKKRGKKASEAGEGNFERNGDVNGSGIKRDVNGIPQEIPNFMMNAAVAARSHRKGSEDKGKLKEEDLDKTPKKTKGKAPAPPEEKMKTEKEERSNLDEIQPVSDDIEDELPKTNIENLEEEIEVELRSKMNAKDYNSDSDMETDNQSSVNTIELNSSDITIHHAEEEDRQNRKTASTGDLTKIQRTRKSSNGTLERAQSLDITDTSMPTLGQKRKGGRIEDDITGSEEDIFGKVMMSKEPRLSLILDGLNTFQRNRLKKSTEWGNLEDAILKLNQEDQDSNSKKDLSLDSIKLDLTDKTEEIDALVNKINEIKRESIDVDSMSAPEKPVKKVKNQIWPTFELENGKTNGSAIIKEFKKEEEDPKVLAAEKRQRKPPILEVESAVLPPVEIEEKPKKPEVPKKKHFLLSSPRKENTSQVPETSVVKKESFLNKSDENKSQFEDDADVTLENMNLTELTKNFIFTEKIACTQEDDYYLIKSNDTNISDDIKVSRHSLGSLERPKSDDAKMNVSNVTINNLHTKNNDENLHSLEFNVNEPSSLKLDDASELYTTALDSTIRPEIDTKVTISTPDIIKNVTIAEAINKLNNDVMIQGPSSLTLEIPDESKTKSNIKPSEPISLGTEENGPESNNNEELDSASKNNTSLTYITEIHVSTPNNSSNVSEIEIIPNINSNGRNLDHEFEDYVKNFETNVKNFDLNMQKFENTLEATQKEPKSMIITDQIAEKELHKIQEIAEEQLKKLPEMRFTTSSYNEMKPPEKRQSQIELLRSNFEKSPPKSGKNETKSRIPIATTAKTPPTSPERRDSRNLDFENDKEILELMTSSVHSTPMASKYQSKPSKNVTVTSIRSNSKIPSGLPVLSASTRPPVAPRRHDDDHVVQVSTNGGTESSFKQWVFNTADHGVTNIVVAEGNNQQK